MAIGSVGHWRGRSISVATALSFAPLLALDQPSAPPALAAEGRAATLYRDHCATCHAPDDNAPVPSANFADGVWRYGARLADITRVIADGVPGTPMPGFRPVLSHSDVAALAAYVCAFDRTANRRSPPGVARADAAALYQRLCAACHLPAGNAPDAALNFRDGVWKHGGSICLIAQTIAEGVSGTAMLPFKDKLTPAQIEGLARYVSRLDPAARKGPR